MQNLNTILVGIDFSNQCSAALAEAGRLAARDAATLHIIHVLDEEFVQGQIEYFPNVVAGIEDEARTQVEVFAQRHLDRDANYSTHIVVGHPVAEILGVASDISADLVVLGARGRGHREPGDIGIVASKCVRRALQPVLLVRANHSAGFGLVIAAVDFSDPSRLALEEAAVIAHRDFAILHVLHINRVPWDYTSYLEDSETPADRERRSHRLADLEKRLADFVSTVRPTFPNLVIESAVIEREGGVDTEIIAYAKKLEADLVVIGSRGASPLKELVLGTTAERIIHRSECSVLTVRPE